MPTEELSKTGKNLKKVSGGEYFRFIISGIETETIPFRGDNEFDKKLRLVRSLKSSGDLLRDIFLISKVKKFELLATYLLFVLKKIEENQITFENLIENYETDKEFIKKELLSQVKVTHEPVKEPEKVIRSLSRDFTQSLPANETLQKEFLSTEEIKPEPVSQAEESMITEEETEEIHITVNEEANDREEPEIATITGLELISHGKEEAGESEKEVFSVPENIPSDEVKPPAADSDKAAEIKSDVKPDSESFSDEFEIQDTGEIKAGVTPMPEEEKKENSEITIDQQNEITPSEENKETKPAKLQLKDKVEKLKKLFKKPEKKSNGSCTTAEEPSAVNVIYGKEESVIPNDKEDASVTENEPEIKQQEEIHRQTGEDEDQQKKEPAEPKRIHINPITEQYVSTPAEETYVRKSEPVQDPEEERFTAYVNQVMQTNPVLNGELERILEKFDKNLFGSIIRNSSYLKECSEEMSFEIITEIYQTIFLYFDFQRNSENIPDNFENDVLLMLKSLGFVETFLNGGEYEGSETLIKNIESIRDRILEIKADIERQEKLRKEKAELEKQLGEKFSDSEQRKKLLTLKSNILEVESIFKSIDSIKGEFQTYEAFRILAQTYSIFKSIVTQSNALNIEKMAPLAESSYIFLKYIQNYRMNPFSEDIKEVLKYIIINFKLLFLGRPTKDLDVFISYLNNPEKIFTQKEESKDE